MNDAVMGPRINYLLRQVNPDAAELVIEKMNSLITAGHKGKPLTMPDVVAGLAAVLATVALQAPARQRPYMAAIINALVEANMKTLAIQEVARSLAAEAVPGAPVNDNDNDKPGAAGEQAPDAG